MPIGRRPPDDVDSPTVELSLEDLVVETRAETPAAAAQRRPSVPPPPPVMEGSPVDRLIADLEADLQLATREDAHRASRIAAQIGQLHEEEQRDLVSARRAYTRALGLQPDFAAALAGMRRVSLASGRWAEALELVEKEIAVTPTEDARAALHVLLARYFERRTERPRAVTELERALALAPSSRDALWALAALHERARAHAPLADALVRVAQTVEDPRLGAAVLERAAAIRETKLDDEAGATALYAAALTRDPERPLARAALARSHQRAGRWIDLAALYEGAAREDQAVRAFELGQAARLYHDHGGDPARARACLRGALEAAPADPVLVDLALALGRQGGKPGEIEAALRARLEGTLERDERVLALRELGDLEARTGRADAAAATLRTALALRPTDRPTLAALGRLLQGEGRWAELVEMHLAEVELLSDPERRSLRHLDVAELCESRLDDAGRAVAQYRRVLEIDPSNAQALFALERLLLQHGDHAGLVDLLERGAQVTRDPARRSLRLLSAARLADERLGDPTRALRLLSQEMTAPSLELALCAQRRRLLHATGDWEGLLAALRREAELCTDEAEALALLVESGQICEGPLESPERARAAYVAVLQRAPQHRPARRALGRLCHRLGRWDELVEQLGAELSAAQTPAERAALHLQRGLVLGERAGREAEACVELKRARELDPTLHAATEALARIHERRRGFGELAELYGQTAQSSSGTRRALALLRLAEIRERHLGDELAALSSYQGCLEEPATARWAWRALVRLHLMRGEWRLAVERIERLLKEEAPADAARLRLFLASLREVRLGDLRGALGALEAAIDRLGDDAGARWTKARLERDAGKGAESARTLLDLSESSADALTAAALLRQAAAELDGAGQGAEGLALYRRSRELDRDGREALWALEAAAMAEGDDLRLAEITERLIVVEPAEERRVALLGRLGALRARTSQGEDAEAAWRFAVALDARHLPSLRALATYYTQQARWSDLADVLARECSARLSPDGKAAALLELARVRAERLGALDGARAALEGVLALRADHPEAFERLVAILERAEEWHALAALYERRVAITRSSSARARLRHQLAAVERDRLGDRGRAIQTLRALLADVPTDQAARLDLAELCEAEERWQEAVDAYRAASVTDDSRGRLAALRGLCELLWRRFRDQAAALQVLDKLLEEYGDDPDVLRLARSIHEEMGDPRAVAADLRRLADAAQGDEHLGLLIELADHASSALGDRPRAEAALIDALVQAPDDDRAYQRLEALYIDDPQPEGLARVLEKAARRAADYATTRGGLSGRAAPIRMALAHVLAERLGRPGAALEELRGALEDAPDRAELRTALAGVYLVPPGRFDLAAEHYRQAAKLDPFFLAAYRGLEHALSNGGDAAGAAAAADVLVALGDRAPGPPRRLAAEEGKGLGPIGYQRLVAARALPPAVHELMMLTQDFVAEALPACGGRAPQRGERVAASEPAHAWVREVALRLGVVDLEVQVVPNAAEGVEVQPAEKPRIILRGHFASTPPGTRRFLIGRAVGTYLAGTALFPALGPTRPDTLVTAIIACAVKGFGDDTTDGPIIERLAREIGRALPRKVRKAMIAPAEAAARLLAAERSAWVPLARSTEARLGLLACGDLDSALRVLRAGLPDRARMPYDSAADRRAALTGVEVALDLLRYRISPECIEALAALR